MNKIGTDIIFAGPKEGNGYTWIASAQKDKPDKIIFREHPVWKKRLSKRIYNRVIHCLSHEPIHCILWREGECSQFDYGRKLFLNMLHEEGVSDKELKEIVLGI